jgi:hypothetical protein
MNIEKEWQRFNCLINRFPSSFLPPPSPHSFQLGKLNKKAQTIKLETAQLELTEGDSTFVTRLITPGGRGGGRSTANSSRASSPQSTTRSTRSSSSRTNSKESVRGKMRDEDHWKENETTETPGRSDFKDIGVEGEEGGEGEEREEDEEGEEEEEERREKDISREVSSSSSPPLPHHPLPLLLMCFWSMVYGLTVS